MNGVASVRGDLSPGELIDRITIQEIRSDRITDAAKAEINALLGGATVEEKSSAAY